jgi:hypothetical protein
MSIPSYIVNTSSAVSRNTIDSSSHQINAVPFGGSCLTTIVLSSSASIPVVGDINYVKFYNSATATSADTPILKLPLLTNQSLTIDANLGFNNGCCVRATHLWADSDTTAPTENITGAFFLRV